MLAACGLLLPAVPAAAAQAPFRAGAAVDDFTPPAQGSLAGDPADCAPPAGQVFDGPRPFAFIEPYQDQQGSGHFDPGDPYLDCNGNGRWDGNLLGGGADTPRFYAKVADPVGARALVVSNGRKTIAVEVLDQEGLFNVYQERIRRQVEQDGYQLDGMFLSATHDESAPDTLGLGGVTDLTSGVNAYWADYMVRKSADAIEHAYSSMRPASIRYAEAIEPSNLRQCWSSYPYIDDQLTPVLQAVGTDGKTIATLGDVSQHAETLGFNDNAEERTWVSSDWPNFFRAALEQRYGGVAIEMAGSVGSVETPEVFPGPISRTPQRYIEESHPAGCRTLFEANGDRVRLGYSQETKALGEALAGAVGDALDSGAARSRSSDIWGVRSDICVPITNALFKAAGLAGVFADRPVYTADCTVEVPAAPTGSTAGTEVKSQVAAFRIGDGEFLSVPGEAFPFTYLRGFVGPQDMPEPEYPLPPWLVPRMRAPFRFVDGLAEDMIGYIFPRGNGVGVPGEDPSNPTGEGADRFGCGHSDDSESANSQAGDIAGEALAKLLDAQNGGSPETVETGRYVMPDGTRSRDPLGGPELKCDTDNTFSPSGPASAVWVKGRGIVHPAAWMSLSGRRQATPDRNTRGYFTRSGERRWLDVFPDV
jgi:hypothetical protein